jgi:uncharacterized membrane protein YgcG
VKEGDYQPQHMFVGAKGDATKDNICTPCEDYGDWGEGYFIRQDFDRCDNPNATVSTSTLYPGTCIPLPADENSLFYANDGVKYYALTLLQNDVGITMSLFRDAACSDAIIAAANETLQFDTCETDASGRNMKLVLIEVKSGNSNSSSSGTNSSSSSSGGGSGTTSTKSIQRKNWDLVQNSCSARGETSPCLSCVQKKQCAKFTCRDPSANDIEAPCVAMIKGGKYGDDTCGLDDAAYQQHQQSLADGVTAQYNIVLAVLLPVLFICLAIACVVGICLLVLTILVCYLKSRNKTLQGAMLGRGVQSGTKVNQRGVVVIGKALKGPPGLDGFQHDKSGAASAEFDNMGGGDDTFFSRVDGAMEIKMNPLAVRAHSVDKMLAEELSSNPLLASRATGHAVDDAMKDDFNSSNPLSAQSSKSSNPLGLF